MMAQHHLAEKEESHHNPKISAIAIQMNRYANADSRPPKPVNDIGTI